jgi:nucleotide-binding universal stress UspA family protein
MATDRKIIIAVDDSETSAYAFTWALHNLFKKSDKVIVLTAAPFVTLDYPSTDIASDYGVTAVQSPRDAAAAEKNVNEGAKDLIAKYVKLCAQSEITCEGEVVKGEAASWIVDEAERLNAQLVVMGSHAYGVLKRALVGSKSDFVLHNATCSVAIVRHSEDALEVHDPLVSSGGVRKIVIAVDESKESVYAFQWAMENFCKEDDNVVIYHVHHSVLTPVSALGTGEFGMEEVYVPVDDAAEDEVSALNDSEKLVEKYMEYAAKETKIKCEGMVVTGQTEVKVCEGLKNLHADAVIIGTRDRGALARTFLGSVSDYLAHNSPCPLIVAKVPKESSIAKQKTDDHAHTP